MYEIISRILDFLMRILFVNKIEGLENLIIDEPSIIVANHSSYLDHFVILYAFRKANNNEKLFFLAKSELFEKKISRYWQKTMNAIPIDRDGDNVGTLNLMKSIIKNEKKSIVIYPEGTRTYDGKVHIGKEGALVLSKVTKSPIIPIGIEHGFDVLPRKKIIPNKGKINLKIGEKIEFFNSGMNRTQFQLKLMKELTDLSYGEFEDDENDESKRMMNSVHEYNELGIRDYPNSRISPVQYHKRSLYISNQLLKKDGFNKSNVLSEKARAIGKLGVLSGSKLKTIIQLRKSMKMAYQALNLDGDNYMAVYIIATCCNWLPSVFGGSNLKAKKYYEMTISKNSESIFPRLSYAKFLRENNESSFAVKQLNYILMQKATNQVDIRRQVEALAIMMRINKNYYPDSGWLKSE